MADRTLYGAFVVALVLRLREQGLRVSPADADAAAMLARTVEGWDRERLWTVLRSILVKRAQDRPIFDTEFARCFDRPVAEEVAQPAPPVSATPERSGAPPRRAFAGRRLLEPAFRLTRGMKLAAWLVAGAVAAGVVVYLVIWPPGKGSGAAPGADPGGPGVFAFDLAEPSMILGGVVALLICVAALLAWRRWWSDAAGEVTEAAPVLRPDAEATGDGTTFRVGSLGGAPPRFLSRRLATELAEILTYRLSDAASPDIDIAGTIAGHMRGEEPAGIVYQRRRELPTVLVLVDTVSPARHWHTLADEFLAELAQRGVAHQRIEFAGSFYDRRAGRLEPRPEAGEIEAAIVAPGWTVTTVFGEVHTLSPVDLRLLRSLAENGPMLFLDHREPWLWDARHAALMAAGVPVVPATARHLYQGLARIFAPDRAPAETPFVPRRRKRASLAAAANTLPARLVDTLGEDGLAWASECALVQPVSFALAEQLRRRHSALASELAFSRLAALPGSWLGPEGLRFGGQMRRQLLSHFAGQPDWRRAGALAVIDDAFRAEPEEETANALWRYARAQVQLFGANTDAALQSIGDIRQQGLIDVDAIDHLTKSLRWEGEAGASVGSGDGIRLPDSPIRGATRRRLAGEPERQDKRERVRAPDLPPDHPSGKRQIEEASWTIEIPESRIKLGDKIVPVSPDAGAPAASFLAGGRFLLVDGHWWRNQPGLFLVDGLLGMAKEVVAPDVVTDRIDGIWTASAAPVAVVLFRGNLLLLRYEARAKGVPELQSSVGGETIARDAMPLVAVSPDGALVAFQHGPDRMRVVGVTEANRNLAPEMQFRSPMLSITFADERTVLVGLQGGEILSLTFEGRELRNDQIGHAEGGATALAALDDDNRAKRGIAALSDGRVTLFGAPDIGALRMPWVARQIVPLPNQAAVLAIGHDNADTDQGKARSLGLSAIVIGRGGECDVIGLFAPSRDENPEELRELLGPTSALAPWSLLERDILPERDGLRVLALSGQRRLLAVLRGRTIEIRPLGYRLDVPADAERVRGPGQTAGDRPMAEEAGPKAA